jgi:hypothetical protein
MLLDTVVMDKFTFPIPTKKNGPDPKVSRFKLFFDKLKIGQSFTCPFEASQGIRVSFIGYRRKHKPKYNLIGRTLADKKHFRFWVVPNDAS